MNINDKPHIIDMMETFYNSEAVLTNGSREIFENDINACLSDSPYLEGYTLKEEDKIIGYFMLAKSFSTEYGKPCIWVEDIYLIKEYRYQGLSKEMFKFIEDKYPNHLLRLEAEKSNESAIKSYKKNGFEIMDYLELYKNNNGN